MAARQNTEVRSLRNYRTEVKEVPDGEGGTKQKRIKVPLSVHEVDDELDSLGAPPIRRVEDQLFVERADYRPEYLDSTNKLFAFFDRWARLDWIGGDLSIPKERYYEHLRMTAERYDSIEVTPHWPPLPGAFYLHAPLPGPRGKLKRLLKFFDPASDADAGLILAMFLTPAWGGPNGGRPAFLIQGPEDDEGRGVGKSKLVDRLGDLYEGVVNVSLGEPIEKITTRLLTPNAKAVRIMRIDNVKTERLSNGDLEALITSPTINGHQLYEGNATRPNTLTACVTINAAQLSKDMTQRVVPIRLDRPTYRPKWDRVVERFVKRYQLDILADIGAIFGKPASPLPVRTRWGEWERQVLGRLNPDLAAKCQDAIDVARKGLDADDEAQRDLLDAFRKSIVGCGIDPDTERVFFERKDGAEIVRIALDDRTMPAPKCYAKIRTVMAGSGVREYVDDGRRGFLWVGKKATVNAKVRAGWVHRPTPPGG